ncbi:MAG: transketolase C-terminal domain-containing protein [Bacteroidota bacterium]|nr:transketolase C-terminal domain-containing protein [Bacteroidota bacterium]
MKEKKFFVSGDDAVAIGARLARPQVISAYPITPQTIVVERLSEMVEDGSLKAEFMHVESEHSAMSAAMGVSSVGARAFTATSSQGLLYMAEGLHYASGGRYPIVMMNANRSVALPWSIFGDLRDSLSQLDSGWIQVYVEDAQEALDMIIQAYKIAENKDVLTPFMVNLDGFVLTHTYEEVLVPLQDEVDKFLPAFDTPNKMDEENPKNMGFSTTPADNMEFKYQQHKAMMDSLQVIQDVDKEYGDLFGRYYNGLIDTYKCKDADVVLITVGSVTGTARIVVDKMRKEGKKVGLLKLRYMRPFPEKEVNEVLKDKAVIGVLDKDISFGFEGTIYTNVNSSLSRLIKKPASYNFVAGMGGRDISKQDIEEMYNNLFDAKNGEEIDRVKFVNMGVKIDG